MPLKYKNVKTRYNGVIYDSGYEATIARELDFRVRAGEFVEWDGQYKIRIGLYDEKGKLALVRPHKVDFRLLNHDGTYTLLEVKGKETTEYNHIRKMIIALWLPFHLDYRYEVISKKRGLVKY